MMAMMTVMMMMMVMIASSVGVTMPRHGPKKRTSRERGRKVTGQDTRVQQTEETVRSHECGRQRRHRDRGTSPSMSQTTTCEAQLDETKLRETMSWLVHRANARRTILRRAAALLAGQRLCVYATDNNFADAHSTGRAPPRIRPRVKRRKGPLRHRMLT